ncbi:hypothetical protein MN116_004406 [Schistosoma mekongi]|uniref:Ig-like domain-containing protein n=1 Tax=Schistosoma mekongi TaxID=38744 RepID=A0AAE1ZGH2_SCHME|nr:hypothetical protein MN116_004406 [Schistosoma mekongi]
MIKHSKIVLFLLTSSSLFNLLSNSNNLKFCTDHRNVTLNIESDNCYIVQLNLAKQRHIVKLIKPNENTSLELPCHLCSNENLTNFQWFRIVRNKFNASIFILNNKTLYNSRWILNEHLFESISSITSINNKILLNNPCLVNYTNELVYNNFNPTIDSGTYVCRALNDIEHPVNFIWYHIDYINSYKDKLYKLNIPTIQYKSQSITNLYQLEQLQQEIMNEINHSDYFHDYTFNLLSITSKSFHNLTHYQQCKPITIQYNRVCYIRIPRVLPYNIHIYSQEIQLIYLILINGFIEFGQFYNNIEQLNLWRVFEKSAENLAQNLNFKLFLNKTYLYIPCQYNLFKQLPNLNKTFQPLNIYNLYIIITYNIKCNQLDNIEIMHRILKYDISKMKINLLDYHNRKYMKLEKLAIEHDKLITLDCYFNDKYTCSINTTNNKQYTIIWRTIIIHLLNVLH